MFLFFDRFLLLRIMVVARLSAPDPIDLGHRFLLPSFTFVSILDRVCACDTASVAWYVIFDQLDTEWNREVEIQDKNFPCVLGEEPDGWWTLTVPSREYS